MVSKVHTQRKFSWRVRMKRSPTPLTEQDKRRDPLDLSRILGDGHRLHVLKQHGQRQQYGEFAKFARRLQHLPIVLGTSSIVPAGRGEHDSPH